MKKLILSSVLIALVLVACGEEKQVNEKKIETTPKVQENKKAEIAKEEKKVEVIKKDTAVDTKTAEEKLVEQVKVSSEEVAKKLLEESAKIAQIGTVVAKNVSEELAKKTQEVSKVLAQKAVEAQKEIEKSLNTISNEVKKASINSQDLAKKGQVLFMKCAGCHGASGEKPALGKSKVIKAWDSNRVVDVLKGYKDGSYGGVMKGVMKGQVTSLSNEDMNALGAYISTL